MLRANCDGLVNLSPSKATNSMKTFFLAMEAVDKFSLLSLEGEIGCSHQLNPFSSFAEPLINIYLFSDDSQNSGRNEILLNYLAKARHTILSANFEAEEFMDDLLRRLTECAIEADELINTQLNLYDSKILNRIALSKTLEKVTSINYLGIDSIRFNIVSGDYETQVEYLKKQKAVDLLGGKYIDTNDHVGNFVVSRIPFENIEKRSEFLLDGNPVPVFITDKKWISKFNAGEIKLAKNDMIKARTLVERSPVNKKAVYYFTEVVGINL